MHICILSDERVFAHMIEAELREHGHRVTCTNAPKHLPKADLYLIDWDAYAVTPRGGRVLTYGRREGTILHRPFALEDLAAAIKDPCPQKVLALCPGGVMQGGAFVALTEKERALLSCLMAANGAPVSRAELLATVWAGEGDPGVVTVYLHYLRKKLERNGHKLFYAVRGQGYALREEENG